MVLSGENRHYSLLYMYFADNSGIKSSSKNHFGTKWKTPSENFLGNEDKIFLKLRLLKKTLGKRLNGAIIFIF